MRKDVTGADLGPHLSDVWVDAQRSLGSIAAKAWRWFAPAALGQREQPTRNASKCAGA
jgi:hypothetical protein